MQCLRLRIVPRESDTIMSELDNKQNCDKWRTGGRKNNPWQDKVNVACITLLNFGKPQLCAGLILRRGHTNYTIEFWENSIVFWINPQEGTHKILGETKLCDVCAGGLAPALHASDT